MSAVVSFVGCHTIAVGKLPVDLRMEVRKSLTHVGIELAHAFLVGSGARLRGVIDEVIGEELIKDLKITLALNIFGVTTDDSLGYFRNRFVLITVTP